MLRYLPQGNQYVNFAIRPKPLPVSIIGATTSPLGRLALSRVTLSYWDFTEKIMVSAEVELIGGY